MIFLTVGRVVMGVGEGTRGVVETGGFLRRGTLRDSPETTTVVVFLVETEVRTHSQQTTPKPPHSP